MLQVSGITKSYRGKKVVDNAGFTLSPGECLGVAGHNGSGKSTLMSIVAQVQSPDAGTIACDEVNVLGDRHFLRTQMGYVPQKNSLLPDLTVLETLRFWQRTYGLNHLDLFSPDSPCSMLGLEALAKKRVGALSGGMQKRLSTALALLHAPRYLLMDEVLPALDRHYREALYAWLAHARQGGCSIFYCSHEVRELVEFCDTVLLLREGKTVFYGPSSQFPQEPAVLDEIMNPEER